MERRCRSFLLVVSLRLICKQQPDLFLFDFKALRGCSNSASFIMLNP